jgi:tRNA 2-selenouridine synthase
LDDITVFERIIIEQHPLIDVRAPVEFCSGSLPGAVNLPIMSDDERRQVGICYKQKGRDEAIALGSRMVSGDLREERIAGWIKTISKNGEKMIYCARGGLRSHIAQKWIEARSGRHVPLLKGGYKAFRGYLSDHLHPDWIESEAIIIGGRTGVGKTVLINKLENSIDLEALANHRGSTFGKHISAQPVHADFENNLAAALIQHGYHKYRHMIVEDEGRHIGKRYLPRELAQFFANGTLIVVDAPLDGRVEATCNEYVVVAQKNYQKIFGITLGMARWIEEMESGVDRIARRLGPSRHRQIREQLTEACRAQGKNGNLELHEIWIEQLLTFYYDPMYDFQLEKDRRTVIYRGSLEAVEGYLKSIDL